MTLATPAPTLPVEQGFAGAKRVPGYVPRPSPGSPRLPFASPPPCFTATLRVTRIEWRFA
ncbi:hypothetical protein BVI2075_430069 [Burkholderia vietnamiensis]|nr:hypothetical protein BVI2075_430069 [Burkholderia vietnamiensis]CAG9215628.1 hypothetical protein BVI1335_270040 [Burkholderia vietnamiensis]